mgnify:CR=1 FL=1
MSSIQMIKDLQYQQMLDSEQEVIKNLEAKLGAKTSKPILINNWDELSKVEDSDTHSITIDDHCGFVREKVSGKLEYYLSTHTFYGSKHKISTRELQSFGFNVEIKNWDAKS